MADIRDHQAEELAPEVQSGRERETLPLVTGPLGPLVESVARVNVGLREKLLAGFLFGALLPVVMGVLNLVVISRMSGDVDGILESKEKVDRSRLMTFDANAQSHYRAMVLLTSNDESLPKIRQASQRFAQNLDTVEGSGPSEPDDIYHRLRACVRSKFKWV